MKPIAILLAIALVLGIGYASYLYLTCQVTVMSVTPASVEADTQQELFQTVLAQAKAEALTGRVFQESLLLENDVSVDDFMFVTYHVYLKNTCYLPATSMEIEIVPRGGDIVQLLDVTQRMLPSQSEGILDALLLTGRGNDTTRELRITYYLWGIPFSLRTVSP